MEFRHFVVPLTDVSTYEVEDAFEWGDDVLRDVIFRVEIQLRVVEEGLRRHASVYQS